MYPCTQSTDRIYYPINTKFGIYLLFSLVINPSENEQSRV